MDTLLIVLLALTTVAIPALTETAAAAHIFDAWGRGVCVKVIRPPASTNPAHRALSVVARLRTRSLINAQVEGRLRGPECGASITMSRRPPGAP